jgi:methyl-accepting chemotaxis protein
LNLDFNRARLQHRSWRMRLRQYLDGVGQVNLPEVLSPHQCELGRWLDSVGFQKYGRFTEMKKLESVHAEMHEASRRVVQFNGAGQHDQAHCEYDKVAQLSDRITDLLRQVEQKVSNPQNS